MGEWRTIDSAPKDGTYFLVYLPGFIAPNIVCYSDEDKEFMDAGGNIKVYLSYAKPTHWMPLPAPPTETAKQLESEE